MDELLPMRLIRNINSLGVVVFIILGLFILGGYALWRNRHQKMAKKLAGVIIAALLLGAFFYPKSLSRLNMMKRVANSCECLGFGIWNKQYGYSWEPVKKCAGIPIKCTQTSLITSGWQTYKEPSGSFSIRYPQEITLDQPKTNLYTFIDQGKTILKLNVTNAKTEENDEFVVAQAQLHDYNWRVLFFPKGLDGGDFRLNESIVQYTWQNDTTRYAFQVVGQQQLTPQQELIISTFSSPATDKMLVPDIVLP